MFATEQEEKINSYAEVTEDESEKTPKENGK